MSNEMKVKVSAFVLGAVIGGGVLSVVTSVTTIHIVEQRQADTTAARDAATLKGLSEIFSGESSPKSKL
ncbi:MAG: hypothetical protein NVSMB19_25600 [Vulcanimicrobiaceae bacterium]